MVPMPIIVDTDPGIDDAAAIAIMVDDPSLDIRLVATVSGNVGIGHTTANALRLLTYLGKRIPVAKGAAAPLMRANRFATEAHGESGMDGFTFPDPNMTLLAQGNAVTNEYKVLKASDVPVTLVTLGPLTNIAMLLSTFPEVKERIARIIMMGGSTGRGNIGIYGEFNVTVDPEAAGIVFRSGLPIVMVGLDIGRKAKLRIPDLEAMEGGGDVGRMVSGLFRSYDGGHIEEGVKMYDPSAAMFVLEPDLFTSREAFVDVETSSLLTLGATAVDFDGILGRRPNATVCVDVDAQRFREDYVGRVIRARRSSLSSER